MQPPLLAVPHQPHPPPPGYMVQARRPILRCLDKEHKIDNMHLVRALQEQIDHTAPTSTISSDEKAPSVPGGVGASELRLGPTTRWYSSQPEPWTLQESVVSGSGAPVTSGQGLVPDKDSSFQLSPAPTKNTALHCHSATWPSISERQAETGTHGLRTSPHQSETSDSRPVPRPVARGCNNTEQQ